MIDFYFFKKGVDKPRVLGYNNKASFANGARRVHGRKKKSRIWRSTQVGRRGAPAKGVGRI